MAPPPSRGMASGDPPRRWLRRRRWACLLVPTLLIPGIAASAQETPSHPTHHAHRRARSRPHHPSHPQPAAPPVVPAPVAPAPAPAPAAPPAAPTAANKGSDSGLPLPRFAALRADEVNMRIGPGSRYPILWLYKRRDLPVQIEREFGPWRQVEDADGVKGWMNGAVLVGTRSFVVTASGEALDATHGAGTTLRDDPRDDGGVVAILRPGVLGRLRSCPAGSGWCRVSTHNYSGWLRRSAIFGLLPDEVITAP